MFGRRHSGIDIIIPPGKVLDPFVDCSVVVEIKFVIIIILMSF